MAKFDLIRLKRHILTIKPKKTLKPYAINLNDYDLSGIAPTVNELSPKS